MLVYIEARMLCALQDAEKGGTTCVAVRCNVLVLLIHDDQPQPRKLHVVGELVCAHHQVQRAIPHALPHLACLLCLEAAGEQRYAWAPEW